MTQVAPRVTLQVAEFAIEARPGDLSAELTEIALQALVDTVGVAIAARSDDGYRALTQATRDQYAPGRATVLATGERATAAHAALLNGGAGHALDYDDVSDPMYGHPSVALYPAVLAVAEAEGRSGIELLEAYAVGFQIAGAIATALPIRAHYSAGWHSTATVGSLAATAACARLLQLSVKQTQMALAIAASTASGSRQNFGTYTKPLHAGLACWSAVTSARLAAAGFTADPDQLEAPLGFFSMYGVDSDLYQVGAWLERGWTLAQAGLGLTVKKYPCCFNTHRTADAAIALHDKIGDPEQVTAIRLTLEPGGFDPLIHHRPRTGIQGKFSAEYVIAAGLIDGALRLSSFTDDAVMRPQLQSLLRKVEVAESPTPPFGEARYEFAYSAVQVQLADGTVLRERVDVPRGDSRSPLARADIEAKFFDCLRHSGVDWDSSAVLTEFIGMPDRQVLDGFVSLPPRPLGGVSLSDGV